VLERIIRLHANGFINCIKTLLDQSLTGSDLFDQSGKSGTLIRYLLITLNVVWFEYLSGNRSHGWLAKQWRDPYCCSGISEWKTAINWL